jgi:chemotaxis protein methyltransferase WspC
MPSLPGIEAVLRNAIGLRGATLGADGIQRAVRERMRACGIRDECAYLDWLGQSTQKLDSLIERVVIPETWFFRDDQPYAALRGHVRDRWLRGAARAEPLRLLSLPCSTGEEPYSMAMTLLDLGMTPPQWRIDACDISEAALAKARAGVYGRHAFPCRNLAFRARYFHPEGSVYLLAENDTNDKPTP